jgi:glycosyltransferase involved in cell wall biosynthesis
LGHLQGFSYRGEEEVVMISPAITVLLPVYRPQLSYLRYAIDSMLNQTFDNFTLLVVEAASEVVIDEMMTKLNDDRVVHHRFAGQASLVDQLNCGLQLARTPLIARMDGDDWSFPERLQLQYEFLQQHPEVAVVGSQLCIMDEHDRPLGRRQYPTEPGHIAATLPRYNAIAHPSVMYRTDPILQAGGYCFRSYPANEDYELWCRLVQQGYLLANLEQTLLRYRIHPGGMKSSRLKGILRGTRLVKRHYYRSRMTWPQYSRYLAEGALLNLPGWVILRLFQRMSYE